MTASKLLAILILLGLERVLVLIQVGSLSLAETSTRPYFNQLEKPNKKKNTDERGCSLIRLCNPSQIVVFVVFSYLFSSNYYVSAFLLPFFLSFTLPFIDFLCSHLFYFLCNNIEKPCILPLVSSWRFICFWDYNVSLS